MNIATTINLLRSSGWIGAFTCFGSSDTELVSRKSGGDFRWTKPPSWTIAYEMQQSQQLIERTSTDLERSERLHALFSQFSAYVHSVHSVHILDVQMCLVMPCIAGFLCGSYDHDMWLASAKERWTRPQGSWREIRRQDDDHWALTRSWAYHLRSSVPSWIGMGLETIRDCGLDAFRAEKC